MDQTVKKCKSIFLTVVSQLLLNSIQKSNMIPENFKNKVFACLTLPTTSILKYLEFLCRYLKPEKATFICSLIYLDRYCNKTKEILSSYSIHKLMLTSLLISSKYNEDLIFTNSFFGTVGGITLEELNKLEYVFLKSLDYCLYIEEKEFKKYKRFIHKIMKSREN